MHSCFSNSELFIYLKKKETIKIGKIIVYNVRATSDLFFVCVCLCARVWVCVEEGNVCETHREKVFKREAVSHLLYKDINTWGLKKKEKWRVLYLKLSRKVY